MTHHHEVHQCVYCETKYWRCPCYEDEQPYLTHNTSPCEPCRKKLAHILSNTEDPVPKRPPSCCQMRRKVIVAVVKVLSKEESGVPDSELADHVMHGQDSPKGTPILAFKFCPWCGTQRDVGDEMRITEVA